jgi:hypothetical protein
VRRKDLRLPISDLGRRFGVWLSRSLPFQRVSVSAFAAVNLRFQLSAFQLLHSAVCFPLLSVRSAKKVDTR